MSERGAPRTAPPASVVQSQGSTQGGTSGVRPVRTARRPEPSSDWRSRVTRAWARHPLVAMARHRRRRSFFLGLHSMLRAGVPLNLAFTDLSRGADKDPFLRAVAAVGAAVARGAGLAEAMRRQPAWFEPQVVEALEAGEVSGTLEQALAGILERMEEAQRLRWRTLLLCLYPAYLLIAFIIGGALLDGAASLLGSGASDSLFGSLVSAFFTRVFQVTALGLALFAAPLGLAALGLEERWERIRLRLPLLGAFHRRLRASRFCQALGLALGAGVEAARSLQMAIEATGSAELRARAGPAVQRLRDGASLTDVVEWLGVLEGQSLRRVATGERTGHLDALLHEVAREQSEAGLRSLQVLMFAIIALLVVFLFATNIGRIFEFQGDYFRRLEKLSHG